MPSVRAAALDAGLHRAPDLQQAGVDLGVAAPVSARCARITLGDRAAARARAARSSSSPLWNGCGSTVVSGAIDLVPAAVGGHFVADDEAAADRVVACGWQQLGAVGVEGGEAHAVGVEGQRLAAVEHEVARSRRRRSVRPPSSVQPACSSRMRRQQRRDRVDVDRVRLVPSRPSSTALSLPWPLPVAPSEPYSSRARAPRAPARRRAPGAARTARAARIGPTVCELLGPMPILKRSKTLTATVLPPCRTGALSSAAPQSKTRAQEPRDGAGAASPSRTPRRALAGEHREMVLVIGNDTGAAVGAHQTAGRAQMALPRRVRGLAQCQISQVLDGRHRAPASSDRLLDAVAARGADHFCPAQHALGLQLCGLAVPPAEETRAGVAGAGEGRTRHLGRVAQAVLRDFGRGGRFAHGAIVAE